MSIYLIVLILLVSLVMILFFLRVEKNQQEAVGHTYQRKENFYNNSEKLFLATLMRAIGNDYLILGKVRVSDVLGIESHLSLKKRLAAYEKVCNEFVDFIICDRRTTKILAVVQLIQPENALQNAIHLGFLDRAFKSSGLPCISFYKSSHYEISDVRYSVLSVLGEMDIDKALKKVPY